MTGGVLVLASRSPRRQALLLGLGLEFQVDPSEVAETVPRGLRPEAAAIQLAQRKLGPVAARRPDDLVLAADTLVALGTDFFGKPTDLEDAVRTLTRLSGCTHRVTTGLALRRPDGRVLTSAVTTYVEFAPLSESQIQAYVATGEPLDKAGAYAIQGAGAGLVLGIRGDYTNVVGLPVRRTLEMLHDAGHPLPPHLRPG